jgi:hypothetical protein
VIGRQRRERPREVGGRDQGLEVDAAVAILRRRREILGRDRGFEAEVGVAARRRRREVGGGLAVGRRHPAEAQVARQGEQGGGAQQVQLGRGGRRGRRLVRGRRRQRGEAVVPGVEAVVLGAADGAQQLAGPPRIGPGGGEAAALVERRQPGVGTDRLAGDGDRPVLAQQLDAQAQLLLDGRRRGGRRRGCRRRGGAAAEGGRGEREEEGGAGAAYQRRTRPVSTWTKSEPA